MASYLKQRLLVNVGIGSCEPPQPTRSENPGKLDEFAGVFVFGAIQTSARSIQRLGPKSSSIGWRSSLNAAETRSRCSVNLLVGMGTDTA